MGCPPELWVRIISGAFKDDARAWWESVRETHFGKREPKDILWEEFQRTFDEKYFPLEVRKMKELEFEKLVQGSMSVAEYEAKFTRLQRFALGLVATEKMRADRFFEGLIYPIKQRLSSLAYTTMAEVIRAATRDERIYKSQYGGRSGSSSKEDQKRGFLQKGQNQQFQGEPEEEKKGGFPAMRAMQGQQGDKVKTCFSCRQPGHMRKDCPNEGQVRRQDDTYICFTCGQPGHWRRDCPLRGQQQQTLLAPPQRPVLPPPARQQGQQRGQPNGGQHRAFVATAVAEPVAPIEPVAQVVQVKAEGKMFAATVAEALAENEDASPSLVREVGLRYTLALLCVFVSIVGL